MKKCICGKTIEKCNAHYPEDNFVLYVTDETKEWRSPVYCVKGKKKQRVGTFYETLPAKGWNMRYFLEWYIPDYRRFTFCDGYEVDRFFARHNLFCTFRDQRQMIMGISNSLWDAGLLPIGAFYELPKRKEKANV